MCGIACCWAADGAALQEAGVGAALARAGARRGPDAAGSLELGPADGAQGRLVVEAWVLGLRGPPGATAVTQPVRLEGGGGGGVLAFNGEIYAADGARLRPEEHDTRVLAARLGQCDSAAALAAELAKLEGPWAIVLWHQASSALYFARDRLGRRSLMINAPDDGAAVWVASTAPDEALESQAWQEVEPAGLWRVRCEGGALVAPELAAAWPASLRPPRELPTATSAWVAGRDLLASAGALLSALDEAVRVRVCCQNGTRVGVLFSGGLDCVILAALAHRHLPAGEPLDLLNVCFKESRDSPDRLAAIAAWRELRERFPGRTWNLVCVNASFDDVQERERRIYSLILPNTTHMDFSIGTALWFAASGRGVLCAAADAGSEGPSADDGLTEAVLAELMVALYESPARVLLSGLGADELMAGYGRHRVSFKKGGWAALQSELDKDIARLWKRNLGRDDRCIADHGREVRQPYLDERVMRCVQGLPLEHVVDPRLPAGRGDKRILRMVCCQLGLPAAAVRNKRAIQFGTRIAQLARGRASGSNRSFQADSPYELLGPDGGGGGGGGGRCATSL